MAAGAAAPGFRGGGRGARMANATAAARRGGRWLAHSGDHGEGSDDTAHALARRLLLGRLRPATPPAAAGAPRGELGRGEQCEQGGGRQPAWGG